MLTDAVRGDRAEGWLPQTRSPVIAQNGMVVTSQPLAAQAGLRMLLDGGNAVDAAVATAAALSVTEPMSVGFAGDLFAILYLAKERRVRVLDASGTAPRGATLAAMRALGYEKMPQHGIFSVTVPGAAWGWDEVLRRHGTMKFSSVLAPAIDYAINGFPVSERIAHDWILPTDDPDSRAVWYVKGKAPLEGQIFRNPQLGHALRLLARYGRDAFYTGAMARAILAKSRALGGTMTAQDLATYSGRWVEPVRTTHHGYEVLELPPPSQGFAALQALNILEQAVPKLLPGETLQSLGPADARYWHMLIEAKKLAYADLLAYNADPQHASLPLRRLLSKRYAAELAGRIDPQRASPLAENSALPGGGDTVVLSTADRWGNIVSWVNSNYMHFGSGITVPDYGFVLHNRGALFSLDPNSPNVIAPGKRPFNTLCTALAMRRGKPFASVGLMGGDMQAQGHAQVFVDLLDLGANVQQAGDMARFRHDQLSDTVLLESALYDLVGEQLQSMGHTVRSSDRAPMGGYQAIVVLPNGAYSAGSDFAKDGQAAGW